LASLSQFPQFAAQAIAHLPVLQLAVPLLLLHCVPQAPQLLASFWISVSQPGALPQSAHPALHVPT
jgi:hypothetical protein